MAEPVVGHNKYGWYVLFGSFQSAMPDEATARRTAASSELLEACKQALADLQVDHIDPNARDATILTLQEAIAKAEGREADHEVRMPS